jgi:hypothetical protein
VLAEARAVNAIQQQIALHRIQIADREAQIERESVSFGGPLQRGTVVSDVVMIPAFDPALQNAERRVDQQVQVGIQHLTQSGTGRAGTRRFVERKVRHAQFRDRRAAVRAGIHGAVVERLLRLAVRCFFGPRFRDIVRGRYILAAHGTRAVTDPREQHPQIGVHLGRGADRRARAAVGHMLVHADRGHQSLNRIDIRFAHVGHHAQRLHVLPHGFFVQRIERQRRFARPGHPGQDDQPVLGNLDRDVFEVIQPCAFDRDPVMHVIFPC